MMEPNYSYVENALKERLRAYHPKPEFVNNLKQRLTVPPAIQMENTRSSTHTFVVVGGLIIVIAMFFWIIGQFAGKKKYINQ